MNVRSLGMVLNDDDAVHLFASRSEECAHLALSGDGRQYEIQLGRIHVEALRDQLPDALGGLDRWAADQAACDQAAIAGQRAVDVAATGLDLAIAAELAGAHEVAASLREAVALATERADALDAAVRAFSGAAEDTDDAVDKLRYVMSVANTVLHRVRDDDQPAALVER